MTELIPRFKHPELFFGFVAPIGADVQSCVESLKTSLSNLGYNPIEIKVTDIFAPLSRFIHPNTDSPLVQKPASKRYESYISYGNKLRETFADDAALAVLTIGRLIRKRTKLAKSTGDHRYSKNAFILHQFKRKEEIDLLRSTYGRHFFQISIYSRRGARVDCLAKKFANTDNSASNNDYRAAAEKIIQIDYNESSDHGQKIVKIFHDADFIVNNDIKNPNPSAQIDRICRIIFGANDCSPTRLEYGMYIAKAAALRTLDLSRQVGAAIFSKDGEIISMGSNEVPKAGGGTYWCDDPYDDREFVRQEDSNERRKNEILLELFSIVGKVDQISNPKVKESQFMDALEYGRIIHAEMSAIVDAAKIGRAIKQSVLYCTTFPCHMCAKHIVGAGIDKVFFLEPYPKSLVTDLHNDSISVEGNDRGNYSQYPAVIFEHFFGVAPRRYRELFERGSRKENGRFKPWVYGISEPNLNVTHPVYASFEAMIPKIVISEYVRKAFFKLTKVLNE